MPWVRLDDRFPSHRKISLLSDRAFRLYVSALCWSSENLTEGHIPRENLTRVAHVRNIYRTVTELEERGLWEQIEDGWVIHDFLDYNPTRASVQADRDKNAARQQAFRERKKAEREAKKAAEEIERNAVTSPVTAVTRNAVSNGAPARPVPLLPSNEGSSACLQEPAAYDTLADLKVALAAAGLSGFAWTLQASQIERTRQARDRVGVPAMVTYAVNSAQRLGTPTSAAAWIDGWTSLEPSPESVTPLRAIGGNGRHGYTDPAERGIY